MNGRRERVGTAGEGRPSTADNQRQRVRSVSTPILTSSEFQIFIRIERLIIFNDSARVLKRFLSLIVSDFRQAFR